MNSSKSNVVLVTVDCMRRDRISAYGYARTTTPFLDSLLPKALHASSAHATSSWTCPSVASLLTGLYPSRHGAGWLPGPVKRLERDQLPSALGVDVIALPQRFPGHVSAAFTAVPFATMPVEDRFDHVQVRARSGDALVRDALHWMKAQERPFVCWVHLGDVHDPLDVPSDLRDVFGHVDRYRDARRWRFTRIEEDLDDAAFTAYRTDRTRLYDAAILGADRAIGVLWRALKERDEDDTVLVVSADHGEELWEHRAEEASEFLDPRGVAGVGHGHNLFQVHLLVPLIVSGPGVPERQIAANSSLVDVVPTLLDLLDAPPAEDLDGVSLVGPEAEVIDRPVFAEAVAYGYEKRSIIASDEKVLVSTGDRYGRAFLLGPDRTEERGAPADVFARLAPALSVAAPVVGPSVAANDEIVEHLRGLGYLE